MLSSICSVEGCDKTAQKRGMCGPHYRRQMKHGDPLAGRQRAYGKIPEGATCSVGDCEGKVKTAGLCKLHYARLLRHGDPLEGRSLDGAGPALLAKILNGELVPTTGECWYPWTFASNTNGYPTVKVDGKQKYVHRLVCERFHGPPPFPKAEVAHSCGNGGKGCLSWGHLRWDDHQGNMDDRKLHGTEVRGEQVGTSKLTSEIVFRIMARVAAGEMQKDLAAEYGISRAQVSRIVNGKQWAHVDPLSP